MHAPIPYRPDIDGLRAVAVLSVIGYHAAPQYVRGGFVGVDVFFVISGFLITTIILSERDAGVFSLLRFYANRARRLFPALVLVLAATWLIGWYYLLPHEFEMLGKHMAAGAGYFINFVLKRESGYFDVAADAKPLLHLWSLAVEEQFYIVWPLLLLLVRSRRTLVLVVAALMAVSFVWSLYTLGRHQASAFYMPQYRIWELGAGALLATCALYHPNWLRLNAARASLLSALGLALIVVSVTLLSRQLLYPGFYALAPVAGAALLIAAGPQAAVNRALLSHPACVSVGLISYPLYLWHWPLLSFTHILGLSADTATVVVVLAASVALATATYLLVERPLRHMRAVRVAPAVVAATIALAVVGVAAQYTVVLPRMHTPAHRDISIASGDWTFPQGLTRDRAFPGFKLFRDGQGANAALYLGDSNMEQYWPRLARLRAQQLDHRPIIFATLGGCPPIPGLIRQGREDCRSFTDKIQELAADGQVGSVVIAAAWYDYFGSPEFSIPGAGPTLMGSRGWQEGFARLEKVVRLFADAGKSVWLVTGSPSGSGLVPSTSVTRHLTGAVAFKPLQADRQPIWEAINREMHRIADATGAQTIDPLDSLCDASVCPGRTADGMIMYRDSGHLRASFVRDRATFIDPTLATTTGSIP